MLFECCWVARRGSVIMGGDWVPTGVMGCGGGPAGVLAAHFGCQQVTGRGSARYGSGGRHLLALVAFFWPFG